MINQGQEHVTNQHKNSPGLSVLQASAPDLPPSSPPFNWNLPLLLFGSKTTTNCLYLPVPGESVTVRTKRREKRRKLLLSAFGNIYPPFIVTLLYLENLIIPTEGLQRLRPLPKHNYHRRTRLKSISTHFRCRLRDLKKVYKP